MVRPLALAGNLVREPMGAVRALPLHAQAGPEPCFGLACRSLFAVSAGYIWLSHGLPPERGRYGDPQVPLALQEIRARQVQSAQRIEEIERRMVAAQVDLKKLSDQFSALETRMKDFRTFGIP